MPFAVAIAVPEGASTFWSWCSSMISALVVEPGRGLRHVLHEDGAQREIRGDDGAELLLLRILRRDAA